MSTDLEKIAAAQAEIDSLHGMQLNNLKFMTNQLIVVKEHIMDDTKEFVTKDSGERQTFATGMVRDSGLKTLRPDLVDQGMLQRWSELMGRGAVKYGERNWEKAATQAELDRFLASASRHFFQWFNGQNPEEDHAAAVFFNIAGAEYVKRRLSAASR